MAVFCRTRPTSVTWSHYTCEQQSDKRGKDQESIQSSTTPDRGYHTPQGTVAPAHLRISKVCGIHSLGHIIDHMFLKGYPLEAKSAPKN